MGLNLALLRGFESVLLVVQIWVVEMSFFLPRPDASLAFLLFTTPFFVGGGGVSSCSLTSAESPTLSDKSFMLMQAVWKGRDGGDGGVQ